MAIKSASHQIISRHILLALGLDAMKISSISFETHSGNLDISQLPDQYSISSHNSINSGSVAHLINSDGIYHSTGFHDDHADESNSPSLELETDTPEEIKKALQNLCTKADWSDMKMEVH